MSWGLVLCALFKIRKTLPPRQVYLCDLTVNKEEGRTGKENIFSPPGQTWQLTERRQHSRWMTSCLSGLLESAQESAFAACFHWEALRDD